MDEPPTTPRKSIPFKPRTATSLQMSPGLLSPYKYSREDANAAGNMLIVRGILVKGKVSNNVIPVVETAIKLILESNIDSELHSIPVVIKSNAARTGTLSTTAYIELDPSFGLTEQAHRFDLLEQ